MIADGVTVYTDNGYYVNTRNESLDAWLFSFRYAIEGYTAAIDDSTGQTVYTLVSSTEETCEDVIVHPGEQRSLFTTPTPPPGSEISCWIKLLEPFGVYQVPNAHDRRGGCQELTEGAFVLPGFRRRAASSYAGDIPRLMQCSAACCHSTLPVACCGRGPAVGGALFRDHRGSSPVSPGSVCGCTESGRQRR